MANTYDTSDLRKGLKIMIDGSPYVVVEAQFVKPGKGAAFTRTRMKNLLTQGVIERNIRSGEKMDGADVEDREVTFLYKEPDGSFVFMDRATYEQTSVVADIVDDSWRFLKENLDCGLTFYNGKVISVNLPNFVELKVTATEPGMRGDTATGHEFPLAGVAGGKTGCRSFVEEMRDDRSVIGKRGRCNQGQCEDAHVQTLV